MFLLFLYSVLLTSSSCQHYDPFGYNEKFKDLVDFKQLSTKIQRGIEDNNLAIDNTTLLTMLDASSKIPNGLIGGTFFHFGNFDECYNIKSSDVYGKYCLGTLHMNLTTQKYFEMLRISTTEPPKIVQIHPQPRMIGLGTEYTGIRLGICIPSFINASEINGTLDFSEDFCYSKNTEPALSTGAIVTIVILSFFVAIIVSSTLFDTYLYYTNKTSPHELFIAFSCLSNGQKIFSSTTNPDQLLCVNGIKAFSMMWVIIGHEYSCVLNAPISNFLEIQNWQKDPANMLVQGATVSVDSFFVVGGLVTVYTFLRSMDKGVKFNVALYYLHRYLRLTPALAILTLIHTYLLNYFGNGPLWKVVDMSVVQDCEKGWWSTLLYITNYVRKGNCMGQTWYLSVDMQLFVLSPLVLLPLVKWPGIGIGILGFLAIVGIIIPFGISYGLNMGSMSTDTKFMTEYYVQTYARFGPYVIGMLLGYFIYQVKKSGWRLKMPLLQRAVIVATSWFVCLTGLVACVYAGYDITIAAEPDLWANSLFIAFNRSGWALALSGLIFLCVTGYGGPINAFLSLPVFQILTKLSYSMYLIHMQLIVVRYASMKNVFKFSNLAMMHIFWADFMYTLGLSLMLCLAFESPIIIIEKFLFGRGALKPTPVSKKAEL